MLTVLTICGGSLFYNETVDGKKNSSYTFIRPSIGLKCKLLFHAFEGSRDGVTNLYWGRSYEAFSIL